MLQSAECALTKPLLLATQVAVALHTRSLAGFSFYPHLLCQAVELGCCGVWCGPRSAACTSGMAGSASRCLPPAAAGDAAAPLKPAGPGAVLLAAEDRRSER